MSYFNTRRTGDIERRLAGVREVRQFFVQSGVQALTAATQLLAALILMFVYSWLLALVFLATVPLYAGLMRFSSKRLRPMFDSLEEALRPLRVAADRRDQGHRDGEGARRPRKRSAALMLDQFHEPRRPRSSARTS